VFRNIGLNVTEEDSNLILHLPKNEADIDNALTILRLRNT